MIFLFDFVGGLLFSFQRKSKKVIASDAVNNILLIRIDQIGDIVMTRPAIRALRKKFPDAKIDLLISRVSKPLFDDEPALNEIIPFENNWFVKDVSWSACLKEALSLIQILRMRNYDVAVDFRGDLRSLFLIYFVGIKNRLGYGRTGGEFLITHPVDYPKKLHQVKTNIHLLKSLDVDSEVITSKIAYRKAAEEQFFQTSGKALVGVSEPLIIIHSGAGRSEKTWGSSEFKKLIEQIEARNLGKTVLIGSEDDVDFLPAVYLNNENVIDLRGKTSLQDLPILFDQKGVFVGLDSGPAHIAAAQDMPVVSIFIGPNDPDIWHPWTEKLQIVRPHKESKTESVFRAVEEIMRRHYASVSEVTS